MPIDTKQIGQKLLAELQRRAIEKGADRGALLEQLNDGSGAHVLVGEKNGEVSLLVPVEDGYDGPTKVEVAVGGDEARRLQVAKKAGTVEIEGVTFNRFILEPLKWAGEVEASGARPEIALRGEGPDGDWSPFGFDGWFMADYATVKWLALSDQMVLAPEVRPDPKDASWKPLDDKPQAVTARPAAA